MATFHVVLITPDGVAHELAVRPDELILDAALERGLDLPYSCLQGWCLSCAGRVRQGRVDQGLSRRFYDLDRSGGFALLCTARPRSDLIIETHASEAMRRFRDEHGLPHPRGSWGP
ncbi:MAG TPA: 2Fe-2S iron-sulfur cluster-binding protein [Polyangia bacterium]|jgi:ferredoxin